MYPLFNAAVCALGYTEELDAVSQLARSSDVSLGDVRDTFKINVVRCDLRAEGKTGEDRQLVSCIVSFDVERRIGFRVAEPLRILQAGIEREPFSFHPGQNVVAGTV